MVKRMLVIVLISFVISIGFNLLINGPIFPITKAAGESDWEVTLNFMEPNGGNDLVVFGEVTDANDGPPADSYDMQKAPPQPPPYLRAWFDDDLPGVYSTLKKDYRSYPDENKVWDLTVQWAPSDSSSTEITITWNTNDVSQSEYDSVLLDETNMLTQNSHTFSATALVEYSFQIICTVETPEPPGDDDDEGDDDDDDDEPPPVTNEAPNTPNRPSGSSTGFIQTSYTYSSSAVDPDGDNIYYLFDWGDGSNSGWLGPYNSGQQVQKSHLWTNQGAYFVKAKAKDIYDNESSWSSTLTVEIENQTQEPGNETENIPPNADFTYLPNLPNISVNIQFTDQSVDSDGSITMWNWDFGDNNISTEQNPSHQYTSEGTYVVVLTVWDNNETTSTINKEIVVSGISVNKTTEDSTEDSTEESFFSGIFAYLLNFIIAIVIFVIILMGIKRG
jgi:PKD repeat protein